MSTQTYIANEPMYNGNPYRYNGHIYKWSQCEQINCHGHPVELTWKPKNASLETKIMLFKQFLKANKPLLEALEVYPNDPAQNYLVKEVELEFTFQHIKNTLEEQLSYYTQELKYIGKTNQHNYINRFNTGKHEDVCEARWVLDILEICYRIIVLSSIVYPNNPYINFKHIKQVYIDYIEIQKASYNIIVNSYNLINKDTNKINSEMSYDTIQSIDDVEPVANHNVLFYTNNGIAITKEDMDNFDFNPVYDSDSEYEDGHEEYDW